MSSLRIDNLFIYLTRLIDKTIDLHLLFPTKHFNPKRKAINHDGSFDSEKTR